MTVDHVTYLRTLANEQGDNWAAAQLIERCAGEIERLQDLERKLGEILDAAKEPARA